MFSASILAPLSYVQMVEMEKQQKQIPKMSSPMVEMETKKKLGVKKQSSYVQKQMSCAVDIDEEKKKWG